MDSTQKLADREQTSAVESRRKTWVRPTVKPVGALKDSVQQQRSVPV